jgi:hypothetical protein
MKADQLRNNILAVLSTVRDDAEKLQKINDFMMAEIYEEPQPEEIPEKYCKVVHDIAENINCGLICYLNPETLELEDVPKDLAFDPDEFELITGESWKETFNHDQWERCITIEPREGHEGFKIMEWFVDEIDNEFFKREVIGALNRKHPFANFKALVEGSKYRQQWFNFKQKMLEHMVWDEISFQIEEG